MITINEFLKLKNNEIKDIIENLNSPFNSHDFIERLTHKFEGEYIEYLNYYKGKGAFRTVHGIIAKYLSESSNLFNIKKENKVKNKNVFGDFDYIQEWSKT